MPIPQATDALGADWPPAPLFVIINEVVIPAVESDGRTWLSASPLCRALGLKIDRRHRAGQHIARLPATERSHRLMPIRGVPQRCAVVTAEGAVQLAAAARRKSTRVHKAALAELMDEMVSGVAA